MITTWSMTSSPSGASCRRSWRRTAGAHLGTGWRSTRLPDHSTVGVIMPTGRILLKEPEARSWGSTRDLMYYGINSPPQNSEGVHNLSIRRTASRRLLRAAFAKKICWVNTLVSRLRQTSGFPCRPGKALSGSRLSTARVRLIRVEGPRGEIFRVGEDTDGRTGYAG